MLTEGKHLATGKNATLKPNDNIVFMIFRTLVVTTPTTGEIDASAYAPGLYIVTMTADSQKYSFKFAKE